MVLRAIQKTLSGQIFRIKYRSLDFQWKPLHATALLTARSGQAVFMINVQFQISCAEPFYLLYRTFSCEDPIAENILPDSLVIYENQLFLGRH